MRKSEIKRKTKETDVMIKFKLEGRGKSDIECPICFLKHMLETLARHGGFDIVARIRGDIEVDQHHTVEDVGLCLGQVLDKALGDKKGINRAGFFIQPMDEALAMATIDISGRPFLKFSGNFKNQRVGDLQTDSIEDFFVGFTNGLSCTLHIKLISGRSDHHKIEAIFKAFARALSQACSINKKIKDIPSTKGVL